MKLQSSLQPTSVQFVKIKEISHIIVAIVIHIKITYLSIYVFVCRVVQYLILLELDMSPMVTVMHLVLLLSQLLYTACGAWSSTIFLSIRYNKTSAGASDFNKFNLT